MPWLEKLRRRWFLVLLCAGLVAGVVWHASLGPLAHAVPSGALVFVVMLLSTLGVDLRGLARQGSTWLAAAAGVAINAGLAPLLGWLAGRPLAAPLADGLVLACALPATIASAIVWTRLGGGNEAVAALVTLTTNLGCFVVLPLWTHLLLGRQADLDPRGMVVELLAMVVAPMLLAQALRLAPPLAAAADRARNGLGTLAQVGVLTLGFLGAIEGAGNLASTDSPPTPLDWGGLVLAVTGVHVALLAVGWRVAHACGWGRAEAVALSIAGSQKTLAAGVGVALAFGPVAVFPLIAYHFTQLVIDTLWVERLRGAAPQGPGGAPPEVEPPASDAPPAGAP